MKLERAYSHAVGRESTIALNSMFGKVRKSCSLGIGHDDCVLRNCMGRKYS